MSLITESALVSALIVLGGTLPSWLPRMRSYSSLFLLFGTGALLGIYALDLLPEVLELGGMTSAGLIAVTSLLYSGAHFFHQHHHPKEDCTSESHSEHPESSDGPNEELSGASTQRVGWIMGSMILHTLANGVFLGVSGELSQSVEKSVFGAILTHKLYESITLGLILMDRGVSAGKRVFWIILYSASFFVGAYFAVLGAQVSLSSGSGAAAQIPLLQGVIWISSIAAGSLLGCLLHDFLIPSFLRVRRDQQSLAWIVLGLLVSWIFFHLQHE